MHLTPPSCVMDDDGILIFLAKPSSTEKDFRAALDTISVITNELKGHVVWFYNIVKNYYPSLFEPSIGLTETSIILTWGIKQTYTVELDTNITTFDQCWYVFDCETSIMHARERSFPSHAFNTLNKRWKEVRPS